MIEVGVRGEWIALLIKENITTIIRDDITGGSSTECLWVELRNNKGGGHLVGIVLLCPQLDNRTEEEICRETVDLFLRGLWLVACRRGGRSMVTEKSQILGKVVKQSDLGVQVHSLLTGVLQVDGWSRHLAHWPSIKEMKREIGTVYYSWGHNYTWHCCVEFWVTLLLENCHHVAKSAEKIPAMTSGSGV